MMTRSPDTNHEQRYACAESSHDRCLHYTYSSRYRDTAIDCPKSRVPGKLAPRSPAQTGDLVACLPTVPPAPHSKPQAAIS